MKFSINKDNLLKPLNIVLNLAVDAAAAKKNQIYNNILLDLTEEGLKFVATDGSSDIITFVSKEQIESIDEIGKVTLSAKDLKSICSQEFISRTNNNNSGTIELCYDEQISQMTVKKNRAIYTLKTLDASSFPCIPEIEPKISFKIKEGDLKDIIKTTKFSMSSEDVRKIFNAMLFDIRNNCLNVVSTDSHRLAYNKYELIDTEEDINDAMMIVGRKAITEMSSLLQNSSNLITINISEKSFSMINENYIYNSKIIDGSWPKYLGLLPNPNTYLGSFTIEKDILKNLINNVSFLCTENLNSWVTIIVDNNKITLKNSNSKHEYAEVTSNDVIYDGEHHEMTLNYKFLTDIINNVSSKELIVNIVKSSVEIELKDNEKDCGELKYIIMLIRL